jgi:hypothetical protein
MPFYIKIIVVLVAFAGVIAVAGVAWRVYTAFHGFTQKTA